MLSTDVLVPQGDFPKIVSHGGGENNFIKKDDNLINPELYYSTVNTSYALQEPENGKPYMFTIYIKPGLSGGRYNHIQIDISSLTSGSKSVWYTAYGVNNSGWYETYYGDDILDFYINGNEHRRELIFFVCKYTSTSYLVSCVSEGCSFVDAP